MDVIEVDRIRRALDRFGENFIRKILTSAEAEALAIRGVATAQSLAARFAAKEAAVKALGTGFSQGIWFHHIELYKNQAGQPNILFTGPAATRMAALGATYNHVSITHGRDVAAAVVILEKS